MNCECVCGGGGGGNKDWLGRELWGGGGGGGIKTGLDVNCEWGEGE